MFKRLWKKVMRRSKKMKTIKPTERIFTIQNNMMKLLIYRAVDEDAFDIIAGETIKCA